MDDACVVKKDTASGKVDMFAFRLNKVYFVPSVFHTWDIVCLLQATWWKQW